MNVQRLGIFDTLKKQLAKQSTCTLKITTITLRKTYNWFWSGLVKKKSLLADQNVLLKPFWLKLFRWMSLIQREFFMNQMPPIKIRLSKCEICCGKNGKNNYPAIKYQNSHPSSSLQAARRSIVECSLDREAVKIFQL